MLNTYYSKLLKLSFVVLLAMVFIIGFTENVSYAYTQNQWVEILVDNYNSLPSSSKTAVSNFLSKNLYTLPQFVFNDNNDLIIMSTNYSSNVGYEYDIHYINLGDNDFAYSYIDNGYLVIKFSGSVSHTRFDFYTNNSTIGTIVNSSSNNITSLKFIRTQMNDWANRIVFIGNKYMKASNSYNTNYSGTYYFKQLFSPAPSFIQNDDWSIQYGRAYQLGTIENYNLGDEINFILVDTSVVYDSIVATLNDGLILTDNKLYVSTNKLRTGVVYDLYYYYDNAVANIYQYSFYLLSGDSGFDIQVGTNLIIDNNNQNTQEIIDNQNQNNQEIIDTITDSGDFNNDFNNTLLDISGDLGGFFGYNDYSGDFFKGYNTTLNNVFRSIKATLISDDDVVYTIPYMKTTLTLNSRDFVTPENSLKMFVRAFLIFGTMALFYKYVLHISHKAQEGNVNALYNSVAVNDESILM